MDMEADRRYFRIVDHAGLNFRLINAEEYELVKLANRFTEVPSVDALSEIEQQIQIVYSRLKIKNPDVAELCKLLNRKIQRVVEYSDIGEGLKQLDTYPIRQVDLSACGIAIPTPEAIELGQRVEIELVLEPGRQHLRLLACVVGSEPSENPLENNDNSLTHIVRCDFTNTSENIQEFLIQYLVKRQATLIKASRGGNSSSTKLLKW